MSIKPRQRDRHFPLLLFLMFFLGCGVGGQNFEEARSGSAELPLWLATTSVTKKPIFHLAIQPNMVVVATCQAGSVVAVEATPSAPAILVGQSQQFAAVARDSAGNQVGGVSFTWASSNSAVATIDPATGLATAGALGTTEITATADSVKSAAVTMTVVAAPISVSPVGTIEVTPSFVSICAGQQQQFAAVARDAAGNQVGGVSFTWASSDGAVTTIDNATGLATAAAPGTTAVTASSVDVGGTPVTGGLQTLFGGTSGGAILKTIDGGKLWGSTTVGISTTTSVFAIAIDPQTPTIIYAGTLGDGIFKSTKNGTDWTAANSGLINLRIHTIAVDPLTPTTLYGGTEGGGVFKSTDSGGTWTAINSGLADPADLDIRTLVLDPQTPATLYAGTGGGKVFKSVDSGGSWADSSGGIGASGAVLALAVDPLAVPTTLYAGTGGGKVFKSVDSGINWANINTGLKSPVVPGNPPGAVLSLAVDPQNPSILYAATSSSGVFKSLNGGAQWSPKNFALLVGDIRSLVIDPAASGTLYAGTMNGVFISRDGAESWRVFNNGIASSGSLAGTVFSVIVDSTVPSVLYAGASGLGIFKSTNSGISWGAMNSGLADLDVRSLAIDPLAPGTLYAATQGGGVFKSLNAGGSWTAVNTGIADGQGAPVKDVFSFAVDSQLKTTHCPNLPCIFAGTSGGGVFRSADQGETWGPKKAGLLLSSVNALLLLPRLTDTDPLVLYAGAGASGGGIFKSSDGGESWVAARDGLPNRGETTISSLAIDASSPLIPVLYAGTFGGAFMTVDGGAHWVDINAIDLGQLSSLFSLARVPVTCSQDPALVDDEVQRKACTPHDVRAIIVDPQTPTTLYVGTAGGGVLTSLDKGGHWGALNTGLFNTLVFSLALDPQNPALLYAATAGGGVFRKIR